MARRGSPARQPPCHLIVSVVPVERHRPGRWNQAHFGLHSVCSVLPCRGREEEVSRAESEARETDGTSGAASWGAGGAGL